MSDEKVVKAIDDTLNNIRKAMNRLEKLEKLSESQYDQTMYQLDTCIDIFDRLLDRVQAERIKEPLAELRAKIRSMCPYTLN